MDACAADPSIKLSFYDAAGEQSSGSGKLPLNSKTFPVPVHVYDFTKMVANVCE